MIVHLRDQGLTLAEIASRTGRTRKTITRRLKPRERTAPDAEEGEFIEQPRRGSASDGGREPPRTPAARRDRLWEAAEAHLDQGLATLLEERPDLVESMVREFAHLPKRTFESVSEEIALEEIGQSSDLRRRVTQAYLHQYERGGPAPSEMEIMQNCFEMILAILAFARAEAKDAAWPRAFEQAVTSGELRKTISGALGAMRGIATPSSPPESAQSPLLPQAPVQNANPPSQRRRPRTDAQGQPIKFQVPDLKGYAGEPLLKPSTPTEQVPDVERDPGEPLRMPSTPPEQVPDVERDPGEPLLKPSTPPQEAGESTAA